MKKLLFGLGLAFGITSYAALKLIQGQVRRGDWLVYVLAVFCIVRRARQRLHERDRVERYGLNP